MAFVMIMVLAKEKDQTYINIYGFEIFFWLNLQ